MVEIEKRNHEFSVVVRDTSIGAESLGFDCGAGQIGPNGSPPQRRFFGAVLSRR